MNQNNGDLQKLIEAAQKSVQDGKEFRTAPLKTNLHIEKETEEQKEEETDTEWNEWGKQIGSRIDEEGKSERTILSGVLSFAAIIFAVAILALFFMNYSRQQKSLSQKPRLNVNSLASRNDSDTSPSESPGNTPPAMKKIATHNGIPSSQAPSWYKPSRQDKTGKSERRESQSPSEPASTPSFTPSTAEETPSAETGTRGKEYQPAWMKEAPPPKTTPQGEPILIQ